jgi:hypothetical protein
MYSIESEKRSQNQNQNQNTMSKVSKPIANLIKLHIDALLSEIGNGRPAPKVGQFSQHQWENGMVTKIKHTGENQWEILAAWSVLDSHDSDYESQTCEISKFSGRPHASVTVKTESLEALSDKIGRLLAA